MLKRTFRRCVLAVFGAATFVACSDMGDPLTDPDTGEDTAPRITAVVPDSGAAGDTVSVDGENFGQVAGTATLGSRLMEIALWTDQRVRVVVPKKAATGPIRVQSTEGASNPVSFRIRTPGGGGGDLPVMEGIVPIRTVAGDTLWITGTGFGSAPAGLSVEFASAGGRVAAAILGWADTEVMVEVPQGATSGLVTVTDGAQSSDGIEFDVAPRLISFRGDLNSQGSSGIFAEYGCSSCHFDRPTGISGFSVGSAADIRLGGQRGSAAVPRHPEQSRLIRVMRGTDPVVPRMPDPGILHVAEEDIQVVEDWIYQGMRNN